jgi:hypothetical protein
MNLITRYKLSKRRQQLLGRGGALLDSLQAPRSSGIAANSSAEYYPQRPVTNELAIKVWLAAVQDFLVVTLPKESAVLQEFLEIRKLLAANGEAPRTREKDAHLPDTPKPVFGQTFLP